jgi:hypothetical protein
LATPWSRENQGGTQQKAIGSGDPAAGKRSDLQEKNIRQSGTHQGDLTDGKIIWYEIELW